MPSSAYTSLLQVWWAKKQAVASSDKFYTSQQFSLVIKVNLSGENLELKVKEPLIPQFVENLCVSQVW